MQKKLAFLNGAIDGLPGFSSAVLELLRDQLRSYSGPRLLVTAATPGSAVFSTDRGKQRLAAWTVFAEGVADPLTVLDPDISRQAWEPSSPDRPRYQGAKAELRADGRTVTMQFVGSPRAYTDYAGARTLESGNAVALIYRSRQHAVGRGWRTAVGETREVTALLARPLGDRVLLDVNGSPVMVT